MEAYVERLLNEHKDLSEKIQKLSTFVKGDIFRTLDTAEQSDMLTQYHAMCIYNMMLTRRLDRIGEKKSSDENKE